MDQKMKTESTFFIRMTSIFLMAVSTFLASPNRLEAQAPPPCQMACTGKVNASMDPLTCETIITPASLMIPTLACPLTGYRVTLKFQNQMIGPMDTIRLNASWRGRTVEISVSNGSGNSCWGNLLVEDKSAPIIECPETIFNLYCFQNPNKMRPDSLGIDVQDCSNYFWRASGVPRITDCPDVTVNGATVKALRQVTQRWLAIDAINGMSDSCEITYNLLPIRLEDIDGPINDTISCSPAFAVTKIGDDVCSPSTNSYGNPVPSITGYPYAVFGSDTIRLIPNSANLAGACNITTCFNDRLIKKGKIMRSWAVTGWICGSYFDTTYQQLILVVDDIKPTISISPNSRTVTTSGHSCSAFVRLNSLFPATLFDACSTPTVSALLNGNVISYTSLIEVPKGNHAVTLIATDESGNTASAVATLVVEDKTPPTAICMKSTVAITNSGSARLPAPYFNNGSKDECGSVTFSVRRMDRRTNCVDTTKSNAFFPHVDFCCTDVGTNVMVELRVTDEAGNSNTCMVEIEVQNKLRPTLICPANQPDDCTASSNVDSASLSTRYGTASAASGCGTPSIRHFIVSNTRNQCGVGQITRKWVVFNGNLRVDSCTQTITFDLRDGDGFYVNTENDNDSRDHIVWPKAEIEIEGCLSPTSSSLSPDSIGRPVILYDRFGCGVIAMTPVDEVFAVNTPLGGTNNACLKILRTWKVIDWCQPRSVSRPYIFRQVIKVINKKAPTIDTAIGKDSCAQLASCTDSIAPILTASASDDCSGTLAWSYDIDLGNNGSFDISRNGSGNSINATQKLPLGSHRIIYTFRDLCGNVTSREVAFRLSNCKPPTPYLYENLAIGLMRMNNTGMITTWASDFNRGSSHPCGGPLYFAFSKTRLDTARTFTCANIGPNNLTIHVGYSYAPGDTVWASANVILNVQDNNTPKACPTAALVTRSVRGQLTTEFNEQLKDAQVYLDGINQEKLMTDEYGRFDFTNAIKGNNYIVKPYKNDDVDNGVNTLDLIRIQRHILGLSKLDSPYKVIAADINQDSRVTVTDLLELRKVVLGVHTHFPNNTSWRFVDKSYVFKSTENALIENFNEQYDILNLNDNMKVDFVSVKVGDIDANATTKANTSKSLTSRSVKTFISFEDKIVEKGQIVTIPFKFEKDMDLLGLQLGLKYNTQSLELISSKINLPNDVNSGIVPNNGKIRLSWNNESVQKVTDVVNLTFVVKANSKISEALSMSDFVSQAYSEDLESIDIAIRSNNKEGQSFELMQNTPNPFAETTEISFIIPQTSKVSLTIYDVKGRSVIKHAEKYEAGKNTISINRRDIGTSGVYYYTLEAGNNFATKKMVIID